MVPFSQQPLDMNFRGLMIESHCDPDRALSDSAQQVTPEELKKIIAALDNRRSTVTTYSLNELRRAIDRLDDELLEIHAKRMRVARDIGRYKQEHGMQVVQRDRYANFMQRRVEIASNLDSEFTRHILSLIHEGSVRRQLSLSPEKSL